MVASSRETNGRMTPSVRCSLIMICLASSGRVRRRRVLLTVCSDLPTLAAMSSAVRLNWFWSLAYAVASSRGLRSSRWAFSIMEISRRFCESRVRTMAGILSRPANLAARQRRSPATILYLPSSLALPYLELESESYLNYLDSA